MADRNDIDDSYTTMDNIWRKSIGEMADFTGAKYDGDFSLSLEEAQRRKHEFIAQHLNIKAGSKVLDMGCGAGHASFVAAQYVKQVVAYDLSSQMLDVRGDGSR